MYFGGSICCLHFLSTMGILILSLLYPCCVPFGFILLLVFPFCCSVLAILFCFGLTYKKTTTRKRMSATIPRAQTHGPHTVTSTSSRWLLNPMVHTNSNLLSKRDAHSLLINAFKLWACDILEDVFHDALQSQPACLSRQVRHGKQMRPSVCNLIKGLKSTQKSNCRSENNCMGRTSPSF